MHKMCSYDLKCALMKGCLRSNVMIVICRGKIAFCGKEQKILSSKIFRGKFDFLGASITRHPLSRSKCAVMKHALQTRSNFVAISLRLVHDFEVFNAYMPNRLGYNRK